MTPSWLPLPPRVRLDAHHVSVVRVRLDVSENQRGALHALLSRDEVERAARFMFDRDRRRFTVARGTLRRVLGSCLGLDPKSLRFDLESRGKPYLSPALGSAVRFNVSHSGEWALIALSDQRTLGVDVEQIRLDVEFLAIAERHFSPTERAILSAADPQARAGIFFACWSRKESYIKARGDGLSFPLDAFDVDPLPQHPARLVACRTDPSEVNRWSMRNLDVHSEYAAALTVEGTDWDLQCWDA